MSSAQAVAIAAAVVSIATYGLFSVRAPYPFPWSAPWQVGQSPRWSSAGIAAIRLAVLGVLAAALAWPYRQDPFVDVYQHPTPTPLQVAATSVGSYDVRWLLIAAAAAAVVSMGLLSALFVRRRESRGTDAAIETVGRMIQSVSGPMSEAISELGLDTDPRGAVLGCYQRLESALAARGIPRSADETAHEFAQRALEKAGVPAAPLRRLTALFQLAAFSAHPIDEAMRFSAIDCLKAIGEISS